MTAIQWDQVGTRFYESGVDRGVLYLPSGIGVPWNGLISIAESANGSTSDPVHFDGTKFAEVFIPGDYAAMLTAYTYPDEFLEFEGVVEVGNGLFTTNQQPGRFGLSYRTMVGSDELGSEGAYKIHILYNLAAIPAEKNFQTIGADSNANAFEWAITAIPGEVPGFRPTAHLIFDSRKMNPILLEDIETTLYGDILNPPTLPDISTLTSFVGAWVIIRIEEFSDGTWTATGPDDLITMIDATTFQIIQANAVYLDADTYVVGDTTH